ncbi:hypothetical protein D8674_017437 [Pyrus ussuriensis x Pyrus communis]|uniref:Integrase catalytic domain-containing protein n=1 Tax=Pyrus ussuriensis x Pyrus communis TaxID=2448454 RepID=A0A5N5HFU9_9ROSA|nr:hypothetical protein D8674_017437 [Pyrus ussuriensis x Pyrus communis]
MTEENSYSFGDENSQIPSSSTVSEVDVNPNQRLSSVLLNEFNYLPWSRAVSLALGGRSKLGFINGSIEVPDVSSPTYEIWLCKDQLVMSWLLNSMERKLAEIFSYSESSFKLWETVKEIVCATIQREEVRRKVMNTGTKTSVTEARAYLANERKYKVKNPHLKCQHCNYTGHVKETCWILHPELKPEFMKDNKGSQRLNRAPHRANNATTSTSHRSDALKSFTANPAALINEFAVYLQSKKERIKSDQTVGFEDGNSIALLGKFAGFLTETQHMAQDDMQGIMIAFKTALNVNMMHDLWIVDSGATDHTTNHVSKFHKFEKFSKPSQVSTANGESSKVLGKGNINLISDKIESVALFRHKARLVARGFTQTFEVDYKETFAPVAKMNSVRVLLSVAVNKGWSMYQMDVKNAFLHGDLEEEVYMRFPSGHPQSQEPNLVCKLHKSIYGLKQSPRAWYARLSTVLHSIGFKRSNADSSLFVRTRAASKLVVLIYVDDLIITGDNAAEITTLKQSLQQQFAVKDLGVLKYFLGIEMAYSYKGLFLNQRKYVVDLLKDANMSDAQPALTPLDSKLKLDLGGTPLSDISLYQRLVGKLIYLTITRPDISHSVSIASQFMHSPTIEHLNLVKRILRYLKGSVGRGILMAKNDNTQIMGYCDADWAGNAIDRKSTTGYCTFVGGNLVMWKSKKQTVIARSSAEAEYRAMASTACELIWLKGLLCDLGVFTAQPMTLFCDNQAAMHIASNPVFHERTKHIEVDCHYVREQKILFCRQFLSRLSKSLSAQQLSLDKFFAFSAKRAYTMVKILGQTLPDDIVLLPTKYFVAFSAVPMADSSSSDGVFSLHHSDHPNLVLVSKKLNGDNYTSWARGMQLSLSAKNKLGFITGDIQKPSSSDDPDAHAAWRPVWDDLRERFSQSNAPRIFQLNRELATISQGSSSISTYFTRLKALWDELASYNDGCTYSCNAKHDRQQLMQFLMGLNESFAAVRDQILLMNPLPTVRQACSSVSQAEKQRSLGVLRSVDQPAAMAVRGPSRPSSARPPLHCTYCNFDYHTRDTCRKLHGYPGPYRQSSLSGAHYFLTIVDDFSRFTWVFLMKHKSDTQQLIKDFFAYVTTQFRTTIQCIRTDNGGEFLSLRSFFSDHGVLLQTSCNDASAINSLKSFLRDHFRIKDLGDLKYFLGIEVSRSKQGIYISQRKYALEILKDYGFLGARPIAFPMDDTKLSDKGELLKDPEKYRRLVDGTIETKHVGTAQQLADLFTKPLGKEKFSGMLRKLGVLDIHSPT